MHRTSERIGKIDRKDPLMHLNGIRTSLDSSFAIKRSEKG